MAVQGGGAGCDFGEDGDGEVGCLKWRGGETVIPGGVIGVPAKGFRGLGEDSLAPRFLYVADGDAASRRDGFAGGEEADADLGLAGGDRQGANPTDDPPDRPIAAVAAEVTQGIAPVGRRRDIVASLEFQIAEVRSSHALSPGILQLVGSA